MNIKYMPMSDGTGQEIVQKLEDICELERTKLTGNSLDNLIIIKLLLDNNPPFEAWKIYANARKKDGWTLNKIIETWCAAVDDGKTYTTRIAKADLTGGYGGYSTTTGANTNKLEDNANLRCIPSTATVEGVDDYQNIAGLMYLDCVYEIDAETLEPIIRAVEGVDGMDYNPENGFIGCIQPTYWREVVQDEEYSTFKFAFGQRGAGFKPNAASIKVDNTVRSYAIRPKWLLGVDMTRADRKLRNGYGLQPATSNPCQNGNKYSMSHNNGLTYMRTNYGTQYGLGEYETHCFGIDMCIWKYGVLGNTTMFLGCRSYDFSSKASVTTENDNCIVIPASSASSAVVGSSVSIGTDYTVTTGNHNTYNDRGYTHCYDITSFVTVTSKKDLGDGNVAIYVDAPAFSTVANESIIISQPYTNGYTEKVLGKHDGTPVDNTSGREPFRLQGIQFMSGVYEIAGDIKIVGIDQTTEYYGALKTADRTNSDSAIEKYKKFGEFSIDSVSNGWKAINNMEFGGGYMHPVLPWTTSYSSYRYRSAYYVYYNTNKWCHELLANGHLNYGSYAALACVSSDYGLGVAYWNIAARPSGTAGNRGEWA